MTEKKSISTRFSVDADETYLVEWLLTPGILQWFPLSDRREIEDAARFWISFSKYNAALTALWDGKPCGLATLYLPAFRKISHQCLFAIIVSEEHRGKGVGTHLLKELMELAKDRFKIELLHLEVYDGNPAVNLYKKLGFVEYGYQRRFVKEGENHYLGKIMMQKRLF